MHDHTFPGRFRRPIDAEITLVDSCPPGGVDLEVTVVVAPDVEDLRRCASVEGFDVDAEPATTTFRPAEPPRRVPRGLALLIPAVLATAWIVGFSLGSPRRPPEAAAASLHSATGKAARGPFAEALERATPAAGVERQVAATVAERPAPSGVPPRGVVAPTDSNRRPPARSGRVVPQPAEALRFSPVVAPGF